MTGIEEAMKKKRMLVVQRVCFWYNANIEKRGIEKEEDARNEQKSRKDEWKSARASQNIEVVPS